VESRAVVDVAVALVSRDGLWLVARRPHDAHLGGMWEFPGGKFEPGEPVERAAVRELLEECAVVAEPLRALTTCEWNYGDRIVRLTPVLCRWLRGEAQTIANLECRWVEIAELRRLDMPVLNEAILGELERPGGLERVGAAPCV
jgi:mutator protein MutT